MSDFPVPKALQKRDWTPSVRAFHGLLNWLDEGTDSDGRKYLEMRRRLVAYFDRKGCPVPDDLADETLNRVARRLEEEGAIESETPARYCYIVARFVFMEHLREEQKGNALRDSMRLQSRGGDPAEFGDDEKGGREKMLNCLERCTDRLDPVSNQIITRYYMGKERVKIENRRALAGELGITLNALSIRACRIREKLQACVRHCLGGE